MGHLQKLFIFISGFSWPCVGFSLVLASGVYSGYGVWASRYGSSSYCRARALGMPALVVEAHGLSCSKARGIFLDQGSSHCLQHWKEDSSPLEHQESLMWTSFKVFHFHFIEFTTILLLFYAFGFFGHKACGSLAPWTRDRTHSPFLGRWSLSHWTTSEVPVTVTVSLTVFWLPGPQKSTVFRRSLSTLCSWPDTCDAGRPWVQRCKGSCVPCGRLVYLVSTINWNHTVFLEGAGPG